jgi:hypothetical protein
MAEILNFHGALYMLGYHWIWLAVALGLGLWTGWQTGDGRRG